MKLRNMRLFHKNQSGFTVIELMVSLAITCFIALGASMSSIQIMNETTKNNDYNTASRNAMNAIYWMGRDAQMAQVISGSTGFPVTSALSLSWEDWNTSCHNVTYSLVNGKLYRTYSIDGQETESLVAEYINDSPSSTYCTSDNGTLILTITSSVGKGSKVVNVTRVREMTARPQL
jgi:prepilin-type N-terminal cleavage/methylation domain-containing protein